MPGELSRIGLPLLALVVGSWVGLGRPDGNRLRDSAVRIASRALPSVKPADAPEAPPAPALTPLSPLASGSDLPDPVPWPRLNPQVSASRAWLLAEGPERPDESGRRLVTFTFDDGPSPETTPVVLKTLDRYGVTASFFLIGRYLDGDEPRQAQSRDLARRILASGHLIGNHTHDHSLLTAGTREAALRQIDAGEASIERTIGRTPILFRPPYGGLDAFTEDILRRRGAELVLWSIEAGDMTREDDDGLADSITQQIDYAGGGTILLHDVRWVTARALPKILDWLKKRAWDPTRPERVGYEIVDLPTYLRETGARPQPFADRAELERARSETHVAKARAASIRKAKRAALTRDHDARTRPRETTPTVEAPALPPGV
ncbi:MAG: polysaccharide deacetylase family protein [Polyangiaceae bacterium]